MNTQTSHAFKALLNDTAPFGPIDAAKIKDNSVAELLFDRENKIYRAFTTNPSIIIGRRGAGKTAYLHSEYFSKKFDYVLECKTADVIAKVIKRIQASLAEPFFAEEIADLWKVILHALFFREIIHSPNATGHSFRSTRDYLAKIGIRDKQTLDDALWSILDVIERRSKGNAIGIVAESLKVLDNVSFEEALREINAFLQSKGLKAVLLIDSLDGYHLDTAKVAHAITGLLKCVGNFNEQGSSFSVRFCLPAELYHSFMELSSNPLKDFEHRVMLHWHSGELLSIVARRIQLFAELYHSDLHAKVRNKNTELRDQALDVFHALFPLGIRNGLEFEEQTLGYILRHTQLLPRQLFFLLNDICKKNKRLGGQPTGIKPEAVRDGIAAGEEILTSEIFSAYQGRHPNAENVCRRCIPDLPMVFSYGELHQNYTRFGKKALNSDDFYDFRTLLIEIGAVGRVLEETDRYTIGLFEYSSPHKLVVSTNDSLCLHPLFASVFSCRIPTRGPRRAVYPYGCDVTTIDSREFSD